MKPISNKRKAFLKFKHRQFEREVNSLWGCISSRSDSLWSGLYRNLAPSFLPPGMAGTFIGAQRAVDDFAHALRSIGCIEGDIARAIDVANLTGKSLDEIRRELVVQNEASVSDVLEGLIEHHSIIELFDRPVGATVGSVAGLLSEKYVCEVQCFEVGDGSELPEHVGSVSIMPPSEEAT